jgi:hypothetical protein
LKLKFNLRNALWLSQGIIAVGLLTTSTLGLAANKSNQAKSNKAAPVQVQLRQGKVNSSVNLRNYDKPTQKPSIENYFESPTPEIAPLSYSSSRYSLKSGCAKSTRSVSRLLREMDIKDDAFERAFDSQAPDFLKEGNGSCIPYSASLDSQRKIQAISLLSDERRDKKTRLITFNKSPTTGTYLVNSQDLSSGFSGYQEIEISLDDIISKNNKTISAIPPELVWELSSLTKEIVEKNSSQSKRYVRVIFNAGDKNTWAQIVAVEILDSTRTLVLANAFWVDREDIPGGFFNSEGNELEQDFWINPLNYTRISRGVGSFAAKGKRTQVVKRGKKNVVITQFYRGYTSHQGIDYAAPTGTPIYAVANGKIAFYGVMNGYGNLVIVEHPGNYKTYYAHLSAFNPELGVGSDVRRGLEIGYVGSTGRSTGPHLHFELRKNNVYQNPMSEKLEIDLWSMRPEDQERLTREIVLFSTLTPGQ